ncbi:hypothetical protein QYF36_026828 [Acer negundo]|nr:hypothetical protein QYF36_026828 [Acer negundo]
MSMRYAKRFSYREVDSVGMSEIYDPPLVLVSIWWLSQVQVFQLLVELPDFRGPDGVWTLQSKGEAIPEAAQPFHRAMPAITHMALAELEKAGILKCVITQVTFLDRSKLKNAILNKKPFMLKRKISKEEPFTFVVKLNFCYGSSIHSTTAEFPVNFQKQIENVSCDKDAVVRELTNAAIEWLLLLDNYRIPENIPEENSDDNNLPEENNKNMASKLMPLKKRKHHSLSYELVPPKKRKHDYDR